MKQRTYSYYTPDGEPVGRYKKGKEFVFVGLNSQKVFLIKKIGGQKKRW